MPIAPQIKPVDPMLTPEQQREYQTIVPSLKSWSLTPRQRCDLELLLNGGFSPLTGFMNKQDYDAVIHQGRLHQGALWPIPITLDIPHQFAETLETGEQLALRDDEGVLLAILEINDCWQPSKEKEAMAIFGTDDLAHPGVYYLFHHSQDTYIGGNLFGFQLPKHYDYQHLRHTPMELKTHFNKMGWQKIIGFQTRNPMHRAHQELTLRAAKQAEANLLIHPVVGQTKPGDIDHYTRVRCYEKIIQHYPEQTTLLSLLPLAMRMAGPKEALWHSLIRKNYGCTHFIVGRDHAGPGNNAQGKPFYGPYDAQELVQTHQQEIGIEMIPFQEMVYVASKAQYKPINELQPEDNPLKISGTEFRRRLTEGLAIPEWFSYPAIITELRKTHPPKHQQGFTIFFTGLSGAGKSTLANALLIKLMEIGGRSVTLLDGDLVRQNLSSELGFSKEHRDLNILRIAYVASEITKHRGIAICAPIAPYAKARQQARQTIAAHGGFIEVYVATPLAICEQRDPKGLYIKARAGKITGFTGIDDPYEEPQHPEIIIDTTRLRPDMAVQQILLKLEKLGYLL